MYTVFKVDLFQNWLRISTLWPLDRFCLQRTLVRVSSSSFTLILTWKIVAYLVIENGDSVSSSQTSNASSKTSRYKIMTVKRGFSREGDEILNYLVRNRSWSLVSLIKAVYRRKVSSKQWKNNIFDALFLPYIWWVHSERQLLKLNTVRIRITLLSKALTQDPIG